MKSPIRIGEMTMAASLSANGQRQSVDANNAHTRAFRDRLGRRGLPDFSMRGDTAGAIGSDRRESAAGLSNHGSRAGHGRAPLCDDAQSDQEHGDAAESKNHWKNHTETQLQFWRG